MFWSWKYSPRNKYLGARLIINLEKLYLSLKKLNLQNDKIENYYEQSHKLGIVPKNLNQLQNKLFGIECNYEELNGIDFKKGCYIGQENICLKMEKFYLLELQMLVKKKRESYPYQLKEPEI